MRVGAGGGGGARGDAAGGSSGARDDAVGGGGADAGLPALIVVGSGIAGLIVAIEASRTHRVTLVTKAELGESNTRYAQGGIAAAVFPDDTVASHVADTLVAGAGLSSVEAVEVLCSEGPARIRDLIRLGVEFDRCGEAERAGDVRDDPIDGLARGLEAAHGFPRILHAGGDATGAVVERALVRAVRLTASTVLEDTFVSDLLVENGRVAGVHTLSADGRPETLRADAVVLASGGAGQLYSHTTNPLVTTGDGVAAAYRAGARLADLEFFQFHPTSMDAPGNFLVSEAVRGEGAVLLDEAGVRFMPAVHPDAELAPRDVVARAIASRMSQQGGRPVLLDATALGSGFAARFPSIWAECRRNGIDPALQPIPVTPAAHYWMGGVWTDAWGRTSLAGLSAVGEVACTGVHGANRLASNSLLESVVFAWRAVRALRAPRAGGAPRAPRAPDSGPQDAAAPPPPALAPAALPPGGRNVSSSDVIATLGVLSMGGSAHRGVAAPAAPSQLPPRGRNVSSSDAIATLSALSMGGSAPQGVAAPAASASGGRNVSSSDVDTALGVLSVGGTAGRGAGFSRDALQQLMWDAVGVHREGAALEAALVQFDAWAVERASIAPTPTAAPSPAPAAAGVVARGSGTGHPFAALEDDNLLLLARLVTRAALERRESRGAHYRSDFPDPRPEYLRHLTATGPDTARVRPGTLAPGTPAPGTRAPDRAPRANNSTPATTTRETVTTP